MNIRPYLCSTADQASGAYECFYFGLSYKEYDLELDFMLVDNMIKHKDAQNLKLKGIIQDINQA